MIIVLLDWVAVFPRALNQVLDGFRPKNISEVREIWLVKTSSSVSTYMAWKETFGACYGTSCAEKGIMGSSLSYVLFET